MTLALLGGSPVRSKPFPAYRTIGDEEKAAAQRVLDSGILSAYLGSWGGGFLGGPEVRALEAEWAEAFGTKHAIAVNSATSGLYAAMGVLDLEPGDEVIVSPYTMTASATAPLVYGATPVFADIEEDHYCLDPASVEARITPRTRAIVIVDIFGLPYDADRINALAAKHDLVVVEDTAQAIGARHGDRMAGSLGHMGIFSLNYHKHIHCGEGGLIVTDDDELATRLQLARNHGEAVVKAMGRADLDRIIGFNYRMPEIEAAIARSQLKRVPELVAQRQENVAWLTEQIRDIPCLTPTAVRPGCTHAYYVHPLRYDAEVAGVDRAAFVAALKAELPVMALREREGTLIVGGYIEPLYRQPLYQRLAAERPDGPRYDWGTCPVAERIESKEIIRHELMVGSMQPEDMEAVAAAFHKVWEERDALRDWSPS